MFMLVATLFDMLIQGKMCLTSAKNIPTDKKGFI